MKDGDDILVFKKKKYQKALKVKVTKKRKNKYEPAEYQNVIHPTDYKQLALVLEDLKILFGAPVEKAYKEMQKKKTPFW